MRAGFDYIGVGVGAMVFNAQGLVFVAQRGPLAKNERGTWEFPGGKVEWGETLAAAVQREFMEEYAMSIELVRLLAIHDHILPDEGQHWISPTYIAKHSGGTPTINEPQKCSAIGWYPLVAMPTPLSKITQMNIRDYLNSYSNMPLW